MVVKKHGIYREYRMNVKRKTLWISDLIFNVEESRHSMNNPVSFCFDRKIICGKRPRSMYQTSVNRPMPFPQCKFDAVWMRPGAIF